MEKDTKINDKSKVFFKKTINLREIYVIRHLCILMLSSMKKKDSEKPYITFNSGIFIIA